MRKVSDIPDDLQSILRELSNMEQQYNFPRRIKLCQRALKMVDRTTQPRRWASLHNTLGNSLAQSPQNDHAENIEQAIGHYHQALEVATHQDMPMEWATTSNNMATAYSIRIQGDPAANIEKSVEYYQQALEVTTQQDMPVEWAETINSLAGVYIKRILGDRAENIERAIGLHKQALEVVSKQDMPVEWARTLNNLAAAYSHRIRGNPAENIEQVIEYYQQALEVMTRQDMPVEWAKIKSYLAYTYTDRILGDSAENIERAIELYKQTLEVRTRQNMPVEWARTLNNLAAAYSHRIRGNPAENIEQALEYYQQALEVMTQQDMPVEWATMVFNLATTYTKRTRGSRAENIERAIELYKQALEVRTQQDMPIEWAETLNNLASTYTERIRGNRAENIEQVIHYHHQVLKVRTRQDMPIEWAGTMCNLATAYAKRILGSPAENIEQAIEYYQQALEVVNKQDMPEQWAITIGNLALTYTNRTLGDPAENIERGIELYQQTLEVWTRQDTPIEWASTLNNLASDYIKRIRGNRVENIEQAIEYYQQTLNVTTREDMPADWAQTINNLASTYTQRTRGNRAENIERAIELYQQAFEVRTRQDMPIDWAETMYNMASTYTERIRGNRVENIERAIELYRQALEVATQQALPNFCRRIQRDLGILYFNEKNWLESVSAYQDVLTVNNLLYQAAATPEERQAELHEIISIPHELAYALAKSTDQNETLEKGVIALEQNRARWLSEELALHSEKPPNVPGGIWQTLVSQRETMLGLLAEARLPEGTPAKRDFLTLSKIIRTTQEALSTTVAEVRKYDESFMPEPDFSQIQEAVSKSAYPVVYFAVTQAGTLILLLPSHTPHTSQTNEICSVWCDLTTNDLNDYLVQRDDEAVTGYLPAQFGKANMDEVLKEVLPSLGKRLMTPLANQLRQLGVTGAILIPGGLLGLLPLGAAVISGPLSSNGYAFLDEFEVAYAPSALALGHSHRRLECLNIDSKQTKLLAVGDPTHVGAHRLLYSAVEVGVIAAYFPSDRQCLLYEERATRDAIMVGAPDANILHFACHGQFDPNRPLDSALLLANNDRLTLADILSELSLGNCRLTILSACQTAITDFQQLPDEVVGLPGGFLSAGASGVLGTLWPVNDISTALLMGRFYYFYRQEAQPPAAALRAAQLWLRDVTNEELSHIFQKRRKTASDRLPISYKLAQDNFVKYATRNPVEKPFVSPRFWASFTLHGT